MVILDGLARLDRGKEVCEGVGKALLCGGNGGPRGGAEQPDIGGSGCVGRDAQVAEGVGLTQQRGQLVGVQEGAELAELLREVVGHRGLAVAAQGVGLELTAAGSATDAEVDATWEHGVQGAKDFGDLKGGVVREHDAAGADSNAGGLGSGTGDQDFGRGAGEQVHRVVLRVPEARVAEGVDVARKVERIGERLRRRGARGDGRLVEYREAKRMAHTGIRRGFIGGGLIEFDGLGECCDVARRCRPRLHRTRLKSCEVEVAVVIRRSIAGLWSATLLACVVVSLAQTQQGDTTGPLEALRDGPLVVWYINSPNRPPQTNLGAIFALHDTAPSTYQEHTTGSFGQSASTYGQNSASYGVDSSSSTISAPHSTQGADAPAPTPNGTGYQQQESGSFGQVASGYGTNAGKYGAASSDVGQTASSFGTAASNHGQDAGSFGESTSTIADVGKRTQKPGLAILVERLMQRVQRAFPELDVSFTEVDPDELMDRLMAAQGTAGYPDVLLGTLPPAWWKGMQSEAGLAMLRPASFYQNGVTQDEPYAEPAAILAQAPHMQAARAFALWMSEPYTDCPGCVQAGLTKKEQAAAAVATSALKRLLDGESLGDEADPAMAGSLSEGVRKMLTTTGNAVAEDASFRVEVEHASTNGSLAAVALRVVASSSKMFGVAHPLVVLRTAKDGRWRVLQMSLNLPQFEQANVLETLMETSPMSAAEQRTGVKGVSVANPQDGATRMPQPELVWDNNGGAGLQVVEWQRGGGGSWSDARLYLVQDRNPRLQTHVIAQFAEDAGRYRWRVWSVGAHGEMKISPWRTFNVVP